MKWVVRQFKIKVMVGGYYETSSYLTTGGAETRLVSVNNRC